MSSEHTVIIGGSSGIGLATARLLLASGGRVTIAGRSAPRLAEAQQQLGGKAQALAVDASAPETLPDAFAGIGQFDHLVLSLGSDKGVGPFATVSLENVMRGFEEKFKAHFAAAQAALPFLDAKGSITFVSAVSAHAAVPGTAGIGSVNAAVAALVPILAVELKPLRVNGVSPGVIDTPWWNALPAAQKQSMFEHFAARTPVGRVGRPEDVAQVIRQLVENTFMSGQIVICDGGLRLSA